MYQLSDSESKDSDEGIRFKTDSIRYKSDKSRRSRSRSKSRDSPHSKRAKKSKKHQKKTRRSTSSSSDDSKSYKHRRNDEKKSKKSDDYPEIQTKEQIIIESESSTFGPALPPHLKEKPAIEPPNPQLEDEEAPCIGPRMPVDFQSIQEPEEPSIGPQLPPHLRDKFDKNDGSRLGSASTFGPPSPPHLHNKNETATDQLGDEKSRCIGPQLPPDLRDKLTQQDQDDDDEIYGPLPVDAKLTSSARIALEERALKLKMDQLEPNENQITAREEWMLELPDVKTVNLGFGPRQFRKKNGPDLSDRSSWTDTPNAKKQQPEQRIDLRKQAELMEIQHRDKEQEEISKKHKKRDKQSLLDIHQEKLKKAKQESGSSSERRPFNREIDLQVNKFDEAQKKVVLKKAQLLDDRFARGQSKFL